MQLGHEALFSHVLHVCLTGPCGAVWPAHLFLNKVALADGLLLLFPLRLLLLPFLLLLLLTELLDPLELLLDAGRL